MKLIERLSLNAVLPTSDKFENLIIKKDIIKKIEITQEEIKKYNIKSNEDGSLNFLETDDDFKVKFTEAENAYLKEKLKEVSEKGGLHEALFDIYKDLIK